MFHLNMTSYRQIGLDNNNFHLKMTA